MTTTPRKRLLEVAEQCWVSVEGGAEHDDDYKGIAKWIEVTLAARSRITQDTLLDVAWYVRNNTDWHEDVRTDVYAMLITPQP